MNKHLTALILLGIAFGFVEAAVVIYLRDIIVFKSNYHIGEYKNILNFGFVSFVNTKEPVLTSLKLASTEVKREAATILMLVSIAYISADKFKQRLGAFFILFAVWDIFYYVFLKLLTGWPSSLMDIDVFFLIPVTWIGPVITPIVTFLIVFLLGLKLYQKTD